LILALDTYWTKKLQCKSIFIGFMAEAKAARIRSAGTEAIDALT
jgi:hypothetical protein